jgi:hypothetical protein
VRALQQTIADLRKVVDAQVAEIAVMKTQVAAAVSAASAASATATAAKAAVDALPKSSPAPVTSPSP